MFPGNYVAGCVPAHQFCHLSADVGALGAVVSGGGVVAGLTMAITGVCKNEEGERNLDVAVSGLALAVISAFAVYVSANALSSARCEVSPSLCATITRA